MKRKPASVKNTAPTPPENEPAWYSQDKTAWLIAALAAVAYYLYSFKSSGYYQHDEIGHLLNLREFWQNPESILGNWAKTGYKLAFALPALLGAGFLKFVNVALAGFSCYLAYKTAAVFNRKTALLAAIFLACQPMWIELSFRNYADSFSGFLLIAALFFHYRKKLLPAALILSFATLVRQEFYLIAMPYGLYLLLQKRFVPALLMFTFPLLYNLWGAIVTHDPLYLYTSSKSTSDLYADQFGKHGFFHFFRMSMVVWGPITTILAALMAIQSVWWFGKKKGTDGVKEENPWFLVFPVLVYLLLHSLFNYEGLKLAASPNLRYMNAIGPVLAVMAAVFAGIAYQHLNKSVLMMAAGALLLLQAAFASHDHNGVVLLPETSNYAMFFFALLGVAVLFFIQLKPAQLVLLLGGASVVAGIIPVQAKKLSEEDLAVQDLMKWIVNNKRDKQTIFGNHICMPYFYFLETGNDLPNYKSLDSANIAQAAEGSIVVLESHYSLRKDFPSPSSLMLNRYLETRDFNQAMNDFIQTQEGRYVYSNQFIAKDQRFGAIVFERQSAASASPQPTP